MSGPKACELKLVIDTVEFCKREIGEIMSRIKTLAAQIESRGYKTLEIASGCFENFDGAVARAERAFTEAARLDRVTVGERRAAAENLLVEMKKASIELFAVRRKISSRIAVLRDSLARRAAALETIRREIAHAHLCAGLELSDEEAEEARLKFKELAGAPLRPCPEMTYENFDPDALVGFSSYLDSAEAEIAERYSRSVELAKSLAVSSAAELLRETGVIRFPQSAQEIIAMKKSAMAPSEEESALIERAAAALAKLSDFPKCPRAAEANRRFDALKSVESPQKRILLYDDLILFCESVLTEERRKAELLAGAAALRRKLAIAGGETCLKFASALERLEASGNFDALEKLVERAAGFLENEKKATEAKRIAEIFRAAFEEMGYETDDEILTAFVSGGRFFMNKPSLKNYCVRVISNAAGKLQFELLSCGGERPDDREPAKAVLTRDIEAQREFCADYDGALEKMAARGIAATHKMRMKPGETRIRTAPEQAAGQKKDRFAKLQVRRKTPPRDG